MFKKSAAIVLAAAAFLGSVSMPQSAEACGSGYYQVRVQPQRCWVPARTERYQVREWVPPRHYYVNQTVVVSPAHYVYVNGCRQYRPPVRQTIRVKKCQPGYYRTVWRTRTIPGYYRTENRQVRVWVSTCHCRTHTHHHHYTPRSPSARSFNREVKRSGRKINREVNRSGRRVNREVKRSGRKINKEINRTGRRIGRELKRLFS